MNQGVAIGGELPEGSRRASVAHALEEMQAVGEALNPSSWSYTLKASAGIDGVVLSPSASQPLQILKPGQIGGAVNINL